jgi:glycolate oxidase FAD binding subunit
VTADPERLRRALGADAVAEHPPAVVADVTLGITLHPADGAALSEAVRCLCAEGLAAIVRGASTRISVGNAPRRADVVLATDRIEGIEVLDADEGVARVRAGTRLGALRDAARAAGWELPLEAPVPEATLGGVVAQAVVGPCGVHPRDCVLGLDVVLGSGERTRCGGRVVKNVTGYDLMKLHTGAFGTLGVIEAAWLRLRPLPEEQAWLAVEPAEGDAAFAAALLAARCASTRAAVLLDPPLARLVGRDTDGSRYLLALELAGPLETVHRDRALLSVEIGARDCDAGLVERALARGVESAAGPGLRFRVGVHAPRLAEAAAPLARAGAALAALPRAGLLLADFPLSSAPDERAVDAAWQAAREAAGAGGGSFVLEAGPAWAKAGRDVFGEPGEGMGLMRALKARFDPQGVLNPGRFAGGI